jgi:hypothetical protein
MKGFLKRESAGHLPCSCAKQAFDSVQRRDGQQVNIPAHELNLQVLAT